MMSPKSKQSVLQKLKIDFKQNPLQQKFAIEICDQMSKRTLSSLNFEEFKDFILLLYVNSLP